MRDATDVPKLKENAAAGGMHGVGDLAPAFDLRIGEDAGSIGITEAVRRNGGGFRDDQTGGGALMVILRVEFTGNIASAGAATGERGHQDSVGQLKASE